MGHALKVALPFQLDLQ